MRWLEQVREKAPFDLVVAANCLNELYTCAKDPIGSRTELVAQVLQLLAPQGTMMIVEPALWDTSRAMLQVRDRLLQEEACTVYSPCLHEHACPALAKEHDWCHEERLWDPPAVIQQIDEEVGFIKDALKFSYVLLRKDGKRIVERRPDVYRVVSELREMKGEKRAWLCNEQGRQEVGRQDRLVSPQNEAFDTWHRGAIVQIERIVRKEKGGKVSALGRIEQGATVKIIRPVDL
jgi:ribosomal protein RSM22 (predicted rRNA methylase)